MSPQLETKKATSANVAFLLRVRPDRYWFRLFDAGRLELARGLNDGTGGADPAFGFEAIVTGLGIFADIGQPVARRPAFTGNAREEHLLNPFGDFAAASIADGDAIDGTNRGNFSRGAAEEQFVGDVKSR